MERKFKYSVSFSQEKYKLLTDDMLYNIILNLRDNNLTMEDLAENLGLTTEELINQITNNDKSFFTCLEGISFFEEKENFTNYSRLTKVNKRSK